ncbi:MAG TPA: PASTA domain-containing protein [Thermoleophilia bacterium]|nr:PASTA domain-containing protein [Thermoleophilia bacterium]
MKRYIAVVAVWVAAAALFATINVQAKPAEVVTPGVVGMTVSQAIQAWADAGYTQVPSVNPGNLDPADVADAVVVGQSPKAGTPKSPNFHGAIFIDATQPEPGGPPASTPSDGASDGGSSPAGDAEAAVGGAESAGGDVADDAGTLSFTL